MELPGYIPLIFILATVLTFLLFIRAAHYSRIVFWVMTTWLVFQGILSHQGFYLDFEIEPFNFLLAAPLSLLFVLAIFISKKGRNWIWTLKLKTLTLLHIVRIPVEFVLYWLFLYKAIPGLMTCAGRNFDILAGITAPVVYYFTFVKKKIGRKGLLVWNISCLLLLLNIVANAVLSAPLPFQQFAFEQPNIAIFYFPLAWLPAFVVPVVLFSHLVAISRLISSTGEFQ